MKSSNTLKMMRKKKSQKNHPTIFEFLLYKSRKKSKNKIKNSKNYRLKKRKSEKLNLPNLLSISS